MVTDAIPANLVLHRSVCFGFVRAFAGRIRYTELEELPESARYRLDAYEQTLFSYRSSKLTNSFMFMPNLEVSEQIIAIP